MSVRRIGLRGPASWLSLFGEARRARAVHLTLAFPVGRYQLLAALLARLARRPLAITHQLALDLGGLRLSAPTRPAWERAYRWYGRAAVLHLAISRHARELLVGRYGYDPAKVEVVPNGVDLALFRPLAAEARERERRRLGLEPDDLLVCTVARLSEQKGLGDLVVAARRVRESLPRARFLVVGEGPERSALEEEDAVQLAGALPPSEVALRLGAADLFALPSRFEGGPAIALMEAMACGLAVVATEAGGAAELVADGSSGRLVPVGEPELLAAAIRELLVDAGLRARLGRAARERVSEGLGWDACIGRSLELLAPLLS